MKAKLSGNLEENVRVLGTIFFGCEDVITHDFSVDGQRKAVTVYLKGMINTELLDRQVLSILKSADSSTFESLQVAREKLSVSDSRQIGTIEQFVREVMGASPVIMIDSLEGAIVVGLTQYDKRSIEEPQAESVVRGSRDGFIESMTVNTSLIRRRLRTPALKFVSFKVGRYSETTVRIGYIDGIAKPEVIAEVSDKISQIDIDGVPESATIEEWIEDDNYSPFPQLQSTERPDVASSALLEGRVVILTDNTPIVLIAPTTFWSLMQSSEDYYERFLIGTLIRWLRYLFFVVALLAPSVYVAILTFHHEMVPTTLLLRIAKSREEIPFPAWMEAFIMEITFEALREAGVRLPKQIGSAVSIVGALVIGQAAIQAGIVSAPMVMIVAITGISSFMLPQYSMSVSLRMLRFPIMILSAIVGLYGLIICVIVIISHLCILRSFGVPYLSPIAPITANGLKDTLIRAPLKKMKRRPAFFAKGDLIRNGRRSDDPT
ncbi:spore germination protein [Cohnella herbarum]|uniref:Spore germination protein n=2 Tax=Cohnella herbarum TaxID=2728023 RepID=A0A7Z2VRM1_9BACL|nr:spore germination protein [Cohnella herbarum]